MVSPWLSGGATSPEMIRWLSRKSTVTLSAATPGMSATITRASGVSKISTAGRKTRPGRTRSPLAGASALAFTCSSFSVMSPPSGNFHLDLPGFDFFRLGQLDGQDTVLAGGFHLIRLNSGRQGQHPPEKARFPFPALVIDLLFLGSDLAFATKDQAAFLDGDFQVFRLDPGQLGPHIDMILVFGEIHQGVDSHLPG